MKAAFICESGQNGIDVAYDAETQRYLTAKYDFYPDVIEKVPEDGAYAETELLFSTWGMLPLTGEQLSAQFPKLQAVYYAAGSVQNFARPFLEREIRVFSAFAANAEPVAEYAAAQIILAGKGFFTSCARCSAALENRASAQKHCVAHPGNYQVKVGILGAGAIGRKVIRKLQASELEILVFDPFLPDEQAAVMGVEKASLERVFSECQTISCHLANNAQTRGMLNYALFSKMLPSATFINTGRGAQVVEADLIRAMREEPERTAVLDVTWPEPPEADSAFFALPNVFLTPHIAGSLRNECWRMGRFMREESDRIGAGEAPLWEVSQAMLATMA